MLMKKLLWTACAAIALTASAGINAEEYVVGTGATYRPFEYETPQKELVGFDVDLMRAIAKAEGFDVKFINTPWEGIFATVDKGDRDVIMSGNYDYRQAQTGCRFLQALLPGSSADPDR